MAEPLPRVTFALLAYRQADVVREAIAAAFAQDYPNLEVLLSDDASPDDTFAVMQAAADAYRGPHAVRTNRNPRNLHIGGHVNTVNRLAGGELVVVAAGDDLSDPTRVRRLVEAWLAGGKRAGVLHSACYRWSGDARVAFGCPCLRELSSLEAAARSPAFVIGATEAWDKALFDRFGDLRPGLVHEDHALGFRSLLAGRPVTYVDAPLVSYRQGSGVSTIYGGRHVARDDRRLILQRYLDDALQKLDDLRVIPNPPIERIVQRVAESYRVALRFEEGVPGPAELVGMARRTGATHVGRMLLKRARNQLVDAL